MHAVMACLVILTAWARGDWRSWKEYHTTMLYFAVGNLSYMLICRQFALWEFIPDALSGQLLTDFLYTLIVFPGTAMLFLGGLPSKPGVRVFTYLLKWIAVYGLFEWLYVYTGHIGYDHGWGLHYSVMFDCVMFPMLWLFYRRPLIAYPISLGIALFLIWLFDVPVT